MEASDSSFRAKLKGEAVTASRVHSRGRPQHAVFPEPTVQPGLTRGDLGWDAGDRGQQGARATSSRGGAGSDACGGTWQAESFVRGVP